MLKLHMFNFLLLLKMSHDDRRLDNIQGNKVGDSVIGVRQQQQEEEEIQPNPSYLARCEDDDTSRESLCVQFYFLLFGIWYLVMCVCCSVSLQWTFFRPMWTLSLPPRSSSNTIISRRRSSSSIILCSNNIIITPAARPLPRVLSRLRMLASSLPPPPPPPLPSASRPQ
jgi:hypothetical protein